MKLLDWITQKPKHEAAADVVSRRQSQKDQQQLQVLKKSVHAIHSNLLAKLNQSKAASKSSSGPNDANLRKQRQVVKVFVNHEEYGLLAIGTLGLDDHEPEIELFKFTPNLQLKSDSFKNDQEELKFHEHPPLERKRALILRNAGLGEKEVPALIPSSLFGAKLLEKSNKLKVLERLFHPSKHFFSTRGPSTRLNRDEEGRINLFLKFVGLVLNGRSTKEIIQSRGCESSQNNSIVKTLRSNRHLITNVKERSRALLCMSLQVDDDDECESETEAETKGEPISATLPSPYYSARPDPKQRDFKPEYRIDRTDSDYVVLELQP